MKALHGNTHFTCGNYYYQIGYFNVQDPGHPYVLPLLLLHGQNFTTLICLSFAFLIIQMKVMILPFSVSILLFLILARH